MIMMMMFAPAAYPAGFKIIIFHYNEECTQKYFSTIHTQLCICKFENIYRKAIGTSNAHQ
jgi:hypothetical protein